MPNPISLDIRHSPANGDGWTSTQASNGDTYSYKYTGGDPNTDNGTLTFTIGNGNAAVNLNLIADPRYQINTVGFTGDNAGQLTTEGNAPHSRVIRNANTLPIQANYKVNVIDTGNGNATLPCDPPIINKYPSK